MKRTAHLAAVFFLIATSASAGSHDRPGTRVERADAGGLDCSAIGELIRANGGIPKSLAGWKKAMNDHGDGRTSEVFLPLSRSINPGSLGKPRKALTVSPFEDGDANRDQTGRLNLVNRLFIAKAHPAIGSSTIEFISWNRETDSFDFGLIENYDNPAKMKLKKVPAEQCASCHKSYGPIFTISPWSDTNDNTSLWRAMVARLAEGDPKTYTPILDAVKRAQKDRDKKQAEVDAAKIPVGVRFEEFLAEDPIVIKAKLDGLDLFHMRDPIVSETGRFDHSSVTANASLYFTSWFRGLPEKDRRELVKDSLTGLLTQSLGGGGTGPTKLGEKMKTVKKEDIARDTAEKPFRLIDYNPFTRALNPTSASQPAYSEKEYLDFDDRRRRGKEPIPEKARATSLSAFAPASDFLSDQWDSIAGGTSEKLPELLGLNPADLKALNKQLDAAVSVLAKNDADKAKTLKAEVLAASLASKEMTSLGDAGRFPAPDTLKHRLVGALGKILETKGFADFAKTLPAGFIHEAGCRTTRAAPGEAENAATGDRCLRCHTGDDSVGGHFPFDPADLKAWKDRLEGKDAAKKKEALALLPLVYGRLKSGSMPPGKTNRKAFEKERVPLLAYLKAKME